MFFITTRTLTEWFIFANAFNNKRTRKNLEAIYITLKRPKFNDQVKHDKLVLSRNGNTKTLRNSLYLFSDLSFCMDVCLKFRKNIG